MQSIGKAACRKRCLTAATRLFSWLPQRTLDTSQRAQVSQRTLRQRATPLFNVACRRTFSIGTSLRFANVDADFDLKNQDRESDQVDVCIVGGGEFLSISPLPNPSPTILGPAGLSAAIRLKQLANDAGNEDFRVLVLEKAGEIGAHILSGAVIEPTAIQELLPDWQAEHLESRFQHVTAVTGDRCDSLQRLRQFPYRHHRRCTITAIILLA